MITGIHSSDFNNDSYLIVNNGLVEDLGCAFTALTGYTKSDLDHKNISKVMFKLLRHDFKPDALEGNSTIDCFLFKKNWEPVEVSISSYQLNDINITLYFFQHKPSSILDSQQSFVDKLINDNNLGMGVYSCPEFRLLKANGKYLSYMKDKYHREGCLIGLRLMDMIPEYSGSKTESLWQNITKTGKTACLEEQKTTSDNGDDKFWNTNLTPITEDGRVRYIISMQNDVTESFLKRKQMEVKNEELEKIIEVKDELLLFITHELKTPLSVITSAIQTIEILCKNELSDIVIKYLNKIRQNTYRQMKLVNNILDNTRLNSGFFRQNKTSVDIVQLTRAILESIIVFAERKRIKVSFSSTLEQTIIKTDVDLYERILLNLLSNAVKFTPEGESIEVNILPVLTNGNRQVCIQVKDNGIGIPNDKKEFIFERFGRVDKIISRNAEGSGIGLYLVKTLVSLMEGEIKLESKEGVGSTFSLIFPIIDSKKVSAESIIMKYPNEQLVNAATIEFSDIYYGT